MTSNINEDSIMSRKDAKILKKQKKKHIEILIQNQEKKDRQMDDSVINKADSLFEGEN